MIQQHKQGWEAGRSRLTGESRWSKKIIRTEEEEERGFSQSVDQAGPETPVLTSEFGLLLVRLTVNRNSVH